MPREYINPEDVPKMEKAAGNLRDRILIRLLFWTSCRISEALGLRVPYDIDFTKGLITIKHLKARVALYCPYCQTRVTKDAKFCRGCGQQLKEVREKAAEKTKMRQIPVDRETLQLLQEYIKKDHTKGLLFKFSRRQAWTIVTNAAEKAGLGELINPTTGKVHHVSPHKLRDAFAIMAVKADDSNDSIRSLQEQMGHANIGTTMKYRKIAGEEQQKWYNGVTRDKGRQLNLLDESD